MEATQEAPKLAQQENTAATAPSPNAAPKSEEPRQPKTRSNKELLDFIVETGEGGREYARQVVEQEIAKDLFDQDWRLARVFAESGVFDGIKNMSPQQAIATAMAKIQLGRNWNLNPADAMRFIYFTNGKPSLETEMHASKLQDAGYDWDVAFDYETLPSATASGRKRKKCIGCTIFPKKKGEDGEFAPLMQREYTDAGGTKEVPLEVSFTRDDAEEALIWEGGKQIKLADKWNFKSWAEDMYFWRTLSKFRRRHAPSVLRGALTREEAEEIGQPAKVSPQEGTFEAAQLLLKAKLAQFEQSGRPDVSIEHANDQAEGDKPKGEEKATEKPKTEAPVSEGLFAGGLGGKKK